MLLVLSKKGTTLLRFMFLSKKCVMRYCVPVIEKRIGAGMICSFKFVTHNISDVIGYVHIYIYVNETCRNFFWNCALLDVRAKSSFKCLKFDGSFCAELPPFKGVICAISPSALHPICFPSPLLWRRGYWSSLLGGRCWRTWRLEG